MDLKPSLQLDLEGVFNAVQCHWRPVFSAVPQGSIMHTFTIQRNLENEAE